MIGQKDLQIREFYKKELRIRLAVVVFDINVWTTPGL